MNSELSNKEINKLIIELQRAKNIIQFITIKLKKMNIDPEDYNYKIFESENNKEYKKISKSILSKLMMTQDE